MSDGAKATIATVATYGFSGNGILQFMNTNHDAVDALVAIISGFCAVMMFFISWHYKRKVALAIIEKGGRRVGIDFIEK